MHLLVTDPSALAVAQRLVEDELDAVERAASRFRPDSEVSVLAEADGARVPVSPVFADLLEAALAAARITDGDVDPTVGSALVALGYSGDIADAGTTDTPPPGAMRPVDWTDVEFDGTSVRVPVGTLLDLGATAKAVAADRCAQSVHRQTGSGALVNLGGDIATAGPAPDGYWTIGVQDTPEDPASVTALAPGAALATSSTQRRRWRNGDDIVHHIIDPRTGTSATPVWRTVSVVAASCRIANTVSTASVIRGQRAPEWVGALGLPARFVDRDGTELTIGGWPS